MLNLKTHLAGSIETSSVHGPADIEGHKSPQVLFIDSCIEKYSHFDHFLYPFSMMDITSATLRGQCRLRSKFAMIGSPHSSPSSSPSLSSPSPPPCSSSSLC